MSFQLMAWAVEQETGSGTRKAVLLALANAANHHTGRCFPSVERLCEETEFGPTAVKNALQQLEDAGFVSRTRSRRDDGSLGTYEYAFPGFDLETRGGRPGTRGVSRKAANSGNPRDARRLAEPGSTSREANQEVELARALARPRKPIPPKVTLGEKTAAGGRANLVIDALAEETGSDPRVEGGRLASAAKTIRLVVFDDLVEEVHQKAGGNPDARPAYAALDRLHAEGSLDFERLVVELIRRRAVAYRERWPEVELTPTALARNWSRVTTPRPGGALSATEILNLDPKEL